MFISAIWVNSLPNIYKSQTLLSPTEDAKGSGLSSMGAQLGGLASFAGVSIGNQGNDKIVIALEVLKSRKFLTKFIEKHNISIPLIAGEYWDIKTEKLILNDELFNTKTNEWKINKETNLPAIPTHWDLYTKFSQIIDLEHDGATNLVLLSVKFLSPTLAQKWAEALVIDLNNTMRMRNIKSTQSSINYLQQQISRTQEQEMKKVFFQLIQEQSKNLMIAEITHEYVFKTIDPAYIPQDKNSPRRFLIVLFSGILIGVLITFSLMLAFFITPKNKSFNE